MPAFLVCAAAVLLFGVQMPLAGLRRCSRSAWQGPGSSTVRTSRLFRDLALIAVGLVIITTISLEADIDYRNMVLLGRRARRAVVVPFVVSRFVFRRPRHPLPLARSAALDARPVDLPRRGRGRRRGCILPFYFITSGVYQNWPAVHRARRRSRGCSSASNAVGIWDELFFICTVFALLRRHFPVWQANLLQTIVFVSFLWELGYQAWGPLLTIPFALVQGYIFSARRRSPTSVVHLLFDAVVFLVIVYAHNPECRRSSCWRRS